MKERLEGNEGRKRATVSAMSISSDGESSSNLINNNNNISGRTSRILSFFQRTSWKSHRLTYKTMHKFTF